MLSMKSQDFKKQSLPDKPGVYFFKKGTAVLYIGKATSLRDRVRSYFGKDLIESRGPLLVDMLFHAERIDWQETDTVLEALILEASLIKKHQPKYNTKEKSDKSFNYVCISDEPLPQVLIVRGKEIDFVGKRAKGKKIQEIFGPFTNGSQLREAMKIIRRIFPYIDASSIKKDNYEFYLQLGLTPKITIPTHSSMSTLTYGVSKEGRNSSPPYRGGVSEGRGGDYKKTIKNLILFFEGKKRQVIKNLEKEMTLAAKVHAFERAGEIKRQLFALQHINDVALLKNESVSRSSSDQFRIEAYDVAHMGGKNMVGVMTVVIDGQTAKDEYRKFKINTQTDANDTGALAEMLERRLAHPEWHYPKLIVVDGSTAQINAAKKVFEKAGISIPIVSVVKDERHKPKAIKGGVVLARTHEAAILLANSEAHRFAISYHKKVRSKNFIK